MRTLGQNIAWVLRKTLAEQRVDRECEADD